MDEQPGSNDNAMPPAAAPNAAPAAASVTAPDTAADAASPGTASPAAAPVAPWEGPAPDAVAWLLVNWHNKHPLARRIGVQDVHTVGAVALPFLAQPLPKEPSLDVASTAASPEDAPPAKPRRRWPWQRRKAAAGGPRRAWSDVFIPGLKPDAVAAMALDHGFTSAPDELPLRRVEISNSELESGGATQSGAWPMELVLLSAAIDAGPARTRVLVGRRDQVLGKRALDPRRLGAVAAVALLLLAVLTWWLWPQGPKASDETAAAAASAASAASAAAAGPSSPASGAAALAASAPASAAASEVDAGESAAVPGDAASASASAAASAALAALPGASAASGAASDAAAAASAAPAASGAVLPVPKPRSNGGRPSLQSGVEKLKEEQAQQQAPEKQGPEKQGQPSQAQAPSPAPARDGTPPPTSTSRAPAATAAAPQAPGAKTGAAKPADEAEQRLAVDDAGLGQLINRSAPGAKLVALVGLPQKTKPEAEAQLARMQEMVGQTLRGGSQTLSGAVFQTKEGWRAAVWPFGSREEAQLINATLLARGVRARAVDF